MIVDVFPFYNETDLLECRLELLKGVVDRHYLIESCWTFQGQRKPYYTDKMKLPNNVEVHRITGFHNCPDAWARERQSRYRLHSLNLTPDTIVIHSDCDELPNPEAINKAAEVIDQGPYTLPVREFVYNLSLERYPGVFYSRIKIFRRYQLNGDVHDFRMATHPTVGPCGWHLSYFGGSERIATKLKNFSHSEYSSGARYDRIIRGADLRVGPIGDPLLEADLSEVHPVVLKHLG